MSSDANLSRCIFLIHRYLGIGVGALMTLWCLSGVVMLFVPYPELTDADRIAALRPITWQGCCALQGSGAPTDSTRISGFAFEMVGSTPVLRLSVGASESLLDLRSGAQLRIGSREATSVATGFGASRNLDTGKMSVRLINYDQWTVGGIRSEPLYRFAFNDPQGTQVYVSGLTAKAVQLTTSDQRFWNWLGAVPHWLYPTILRQYPKLWAQVVIWTALAGCFLTLTGLYIGVRQFIRGAQGRRWASPHRGLMLWHHLPGLVFGPLALAWVSSGLLSMNPGGVMQTQGEAHDTAELAGANPTWSSVRRFIGSIAQSAPRNIVSLKSADLGGDLFVMMTTLSGDRHRLDANATPAPLSPIEITAAAGRLQRRDTAAHDAAARWELMAAEDDYWYSIGRQRALFPVIRVLLEADLTRYYLDSQSGQLLQKIDAGSRAYRWWHSGLHRLDFTPGLRSDRCRRYFILPLLLGVGLLCATGAYLGLRRLR
jgi:uncharacterized iron-regulated membrane protein